MCTSLDSKKYKSGVKGVDMLKNVAIRKRECSGKMPSGDRTWPHLCVGYIIKSFAVAHVDQRDNSKGCTLSFSVKAFREWYAKSLGSAGKTGERCGEKPYQGHETETK